MLTCGPGSARARLASGLDVFGRGAIAVAVTGGAGTARATRTGDAVLRRGLVTGAMQGGLLAARALGLLS